MLTGVVARDGNQSVPDGSRSEEEEFEERESERVVLKK